MTVHAFTGGAGCGKTYQLMKALSCHLEANPLREGQKVLALTFMHGSRRRLEERLAQQPAARGRTNCSTIDSFAWQLVRRWSSLAAALGFTRLEPDQYEGVCDAAGGLLQVDEVRGWVAATYPILLVDEAQDLTANRLRVVEGLSARQEVFAAADEFQCLNEELRPNPACTWLAQVCSAQELIQPRRTRVTELLDAAAAIRRGEPPTSGTAFKVQLTPKLPLAGTWLIQNLCWFGGGKRVAVITPSLCPFSLGTVSWAAANRTKRGSGPYSIKWEESETKAAESYLSKIALQDVNDIPTLVSILDNAGDFRVARDLADWLDIQKRARGKVTFTRSEIEQAIRQGFAQRRRAHKGDGEGWKGMTVHGAKNREFDNVIVLWPAATGGSDDQKRRLLYNAVTRAKNRCLVLIQAKACLTQPPFA
ncbi:ATP-binding domain-containing protein [Mesoterricola sediminis]|uniref:DNA 3'-5' helicase II n=1 Tax=Mesoterricola sediminis TaxID=2927980 RepID=A0AA48KEM1_9BACT|nr:hypothetical protein METESE_23950 [Mesoterricola sediminis]